MMIFALFLLFCYVHREACMNKTVKKLLMLIGVVAVFVVFCVLLNLRGVETFEDKYAGHDLTADAEGAVREGTYTRYLNAHADAARPQA